MNLSENRGKKRTKKIENSQKNEERGEHIRRGHSLQDPNVAERYAPLSISTVAFVCFKQFGFLQVFCKNFRSKHGKLNYLRFITAKIHNNLRINAKFPGKYRKNMKKTKARGF